MKTNSPSHRNPGRPPGADASSPTLRDLASGRRSVDWLWPGWIPRGTLTLLAAAPGTGKSLVALDLARRIIAGLPFPDGWLREEVVRACSSGGTPQLPEGVALPEGAAVLLVDAEGPLSVLEERARAFEIDVSRLHVMMPRGSSIFNLASPPQLKLLTCTIRDLRPSLVIIDSLGAALPGGESLPKGLHALLSVLPRLAAATNVPILVVHHLRKRTYAARFAAARPVSPDDLRGSSHIVAVARSILALSPVTPFPLLPDTPEPPAARRLEVIKSNLCRRPPPLGLLIESDDAGFPVLHYTGPITTPPPLSGQVELCARWLLDHLAAAGEPLRPAAILQAAAEEGFSRNTVHRARHALGDRILILGTSTHDTTRHWTLSPTPPART
jgi:hypothetical protein